jgi:hypothetical protein
VLLTLLIWGVYFCVFYLYGNLLCRIGTRNAGQTDWVSAVLLGMVFCTGLSMWFSLALPLERWPLLLTLIGALVIAVYLLRGQHIRIQRVEFSRYRLPDYVTLALQIIIFLFVLSNTLAPPANPDTSLYHAQAIRWAEEYPVVPGLVHLHSRLAFNSAWLVLNALFSFSALGGISLHVLPGFFYGVTLCALLGSVRKMMSGRAGMSGVFSLLMIPLIFMASASEISSPGSDLPVLLAAALLVKYALEWLESRSKVYLMVIIALAVLSLALKLSAAPLLLFLPVLLILGRGERWWMIRAAVGLALFLWIPWMARSVVMSGYLVYPVPFPDLFNFDWKAPVSQLIQEQRVIRAWALAPRMDTEAALGLSFGGWLKMWVANLSINRRLLVAGAFLAPLELIVPLLFSRISPKLRIVNHLPAFLPVYAGLWYWFLSAPDIRFGYAYLLPVVVLGIVPVIHLGAQLIDRPALAGSLLMGAQVLVAALLLVMLARSVDVNALPARLIRPADYPKSPTETCRMGDFSVLCAQSWSECWYAPFPCVPSADTGTFLRGNDLGDGFYKERE